MKAFRLSAHDAPPVLADLPCPSPASGEVLVRIRACGLNFADLLTIRGQYQDMPDLPATLGMELSGEVVGHGEGVASPPLGTRVAVYSGFGGLAEYGVFPSARCLPIPDEMTFEEAAGFLIAYGTSHLALTRTARLAPGETLLVLGAAGGVGLTAVELGAALGARVIAVARGEEKLRIAEAAGADTVLNSDTDDIRLAVKAMGGADVVYDAVGGEMTRAALRATRPEGRILLIGFASGTVPELPPNHLLVKNVSVHGFYWGGYLKFAPEVLDGSLTELFELYRDRRLKPHISQVLPLDRVEDGLELLRSRRSTGKVVILP